MIRTPAFLLGAALLILGGSSALVGREFYGTLPEEKAVGDWRYYDNAWKHRVSIGSREIVHWAWNKAPDGRYATLGIGDCTRYSVYFSFEPDAAFKGKDDSFYSEYSKLGGSIVYTKVLPSGALLDTTFLHGGLADGFYFDSEAMMRADKFLICPTNEEGPRCLTFSLRGFTAALKMVCPKR